MGKVDACFRLLGDHIPADHGYHLYAAVSELVPGLHDDKDVGIHAISGRLIGDRKLALTDRSFLTIRLASEGIKEVVPLAGKRISVGPAQIRVGVPQTLSLIPFGRRHYIMGNAIIEALNRIAEEREQDLSCSLTTSR